jgi:hypothetical protein
MATNNDLFKTALAALNVISEIETPSAEQGAFCLARLNDMMATWGEDGIDIGYYVQSSPTDTAPIPDWAREGVESNLAIKIAPRYNATASPELVATAMNSYATILRKAIVENARTANMDHMPLGAGGRRWRYNIETDRSY